MSIRISRWVSWVKICQKFSGSRNFPIVPGQNGGVWTCIQLPPRQRRRQPIVGRRGAYGGGGGVAAAHKGLLPPPPPRRAAAWHTRGEAGFFLSSFFVSNRVNERLKTNGFHIPAQPCFRFILPAGSLLLIWNQRHLKTEQRKTDADLLVSMEFLKKSAINL